MRRWRMVAGIALALVLCTPAAAATPQDAASTHAFLTAAARFLDITIARQHQVAASVDGLITHVDSACPHAIPHSLWAGTPAQRATIGRFDTARFGEVIVAEIHPARSAYHSFSQAIARLEWSDQDLNRRIAVAVGQVRAVAGLRAPDICAQAGLARASNFSETPPGIRAFLRRFVEATSSGSSTLGELAELMKPLASPGDFALINHVDQLQARAGRILNRVAVRGLAMLARALYG